MSLLIKNIVMSHIVYISYTFYQMPFPSKRMVLTTFVKQHTNSVDMVGKKKIFSFDKLSIPWGGGGYTGLVLVGMCSHEI